MAFQELADLDCSTCITLGGTDKKTNKANPTQLSGFYIGHRQVPSKKSKTGFTNLHIFQTPKGNVGVWGKTNLDTKLASVEVGCMVRVTFTGMVPTNNNPMYKFRVEVDADQRIEVAGASTDDDTSQVNDAEQAYDDSPVEESDPGEEGEPEPMDTPPPAAARPPKQPAQRPDAARQAQVQALLNKGKSRPAA